jgi:hypothetical protein
VALDRVHSAAARIDLDELAHRAPAVAAARDMDDNVDGRANLRTNRSQRERDTAVERERLETRERVARVVRVKRRERAVVARVASLQHVERFAAAHFADDQAVGAHAQRRAHEVADIHRAGALSVGRPRFEPHNVRLPELQLGRLLNGDDPFVAVDLACEGVAQRRLPGAGATGHQNVGTRSHEAREQRGAEVVKAERLQANAACDEPPDRDARTVGRERRQHRVKPRAVGETGVDDGRCPVESKPQRTDDALDETRDRWGVERARHTRELSVALDVHMIGTVDHDFGDRRIVQPRFEWAESTDLIDQLVEQSIGRVAVRERFLLAKQLRQIGTELFSIEQRRIERRPQQPPLQ